MSQLAHVFFKKIGDTSKLSDRELIDFFVYFLTVEEGHAAANATSIANCFKTCDLTAPARIGPHLSEGLSSNPQRFVKVDGGYKLQHHHRKLLETRLGGKSISGKRDISQLSADLRAEAAKINDTTTRAFAEEANKCYEEELYRSAIVMSWLAAMDVLYHVVHTSHLAAFNVEATRVDSKWKAATSVDDLTWMKESHFLDRLVSISLIGKNVKAELKQCLDRRNGCGHPNSLKIGPNTVAHHLEILLLNVFQPFA